MAVSAVKLTSALVFKINTGTDAMGNNIIRNTTIKNVKTAALDQDVFDVAAGLAGLFKNPVTGYLRQDTNELLNQA